MIIAMCVKIIFLNLSLHPWTRDDFLAIPRHIKVCKEIYNSCPKYIKKLDKLEYDVVCR